jgi:MATE family multidrug resistance protein
MAEEFVWAQWWSILPFMAWWAMRQYLAGRGIVAPATWLAVLANVVNLAGNWALVYGHLGFEAHGLAGSGMATAISRTFMAAGLAAWIIARRLHAGAWVAWSLAALRPSGQGELLKHGLPAGGQFAAEIWGFSITGLLAGRLGAAQIAAHQLALNLASLSFMLPMGISIAAATRVGNLTGAGDEREARLAARVALGMGATIMLGSALVFVLGRHVLPPLYGVTPDVAAMAAVVLPIAATFQIFDGTQVVGCGVLRGRGDTQPGLWFNLIGYYVLGLPCAWLLAFRFGLGLSGLWWGLVVGLATVAVLLTARILRKH